MLNRLAIDWITTNTKDLVNNFWRFSSIPEANWKYHNQLNSIFNLLKKFKWMHFSLIRFNAYCSLFNWISCLQLMQRTIERVNKVSKKKMQANKTLLGKKKAYSPYCLGRWLKPVYLSCTNCFQLKTFSNGSLNTINIYCLSVSFIIIACAI